MHLTYNRPARRALVSLMLVAIVSSTCAPRRADAFLFPILGAPFRAIGRLLGLGQGGDFAFPILGAPFRAIANLRENSPFAFPILGAPFRLLAGGPVFATRADVSTSVEGSLP